MQKIVNKKSFSLLVLGMMLATLLLAMTPAQATITTTYYEVFDSETANTNPDGTWYTYAESGFAYSNVNGSQVFLLNDSTSPPAAGYANFSFASLPATHSNIEYIHYSYFYFNFKYNVSANPLDRSNHSGIKFIMAGASTICSVYVYGTNASVEANRDRIVITDYAGVEVVNTTSLYQYEYGVAYDPDYDANTITIRLINESAGGTTMNTTTISLNSEDNMMKFYMTNTPASQPVYICIDDLTLVKEVPNYTNYNSVTQLIVITAVPLILFVFLIFMVLTENITKEFLVSYVVIFFLAMITLAFIYS